MFWRLPCAVLGLFIGVFCETQYNDFRQQNWILPVIIILSLIFTTLTKLHKNFILFKWIAIGLCIGISYTTIYNPFVKTPITMLDQQRADVYAVVTEYPQIYEQNQRVSLKIYTKKSNLNMKIPYFYTLAYLPLTDEPITAGDIVKTKLFFYIGSDDAGFDRDTYYSGENYHILSECAYEPTFKVEKLDKIPLLLRSKILAHNLKLNLENKLNETDAGFMKGLIFGDTQTLSIFIKQDFQKSGLSHVLSVSGMHVGFLVMLFLTLFGKRFGMIMACIALIFFVPMTGSSPSIIRAVIMYFITVGAFYLRRDNSLLHSLCIALAVLLFINPYSVQSISLQLSFLATLGIILFNKPVQNLLMKPFKNLKPHTVFNSLAHILTGAVSCSISACVLSSPVMLFQFGYVSVSSTLANIMTIAVFSSLFILGLILCILSNISFVAFPIAKLVHILCQYVFFVSDFTGNLSGFLVYWDNLKIKLLIITLYVFLILWYIFRKHLNCYLGTAITAIIITSMVLININLENKRYEVKLFDDGGQTIAVSSMGKQFAVIDCAGTNSQSACDSVLAYMDWYNYKKIDLLVLTALDNGHAKSAKQLLDKTKVERCIIPNNYNQSDIAQEIIDTLISKNITTVYWTKAGESEISPKSLGISIIGGMDKKLGVRIKNGDVDLLTMHSFTPKMLDEFLSECNLNCKGIILSNTFLGNDERIPEVLNTLHPSKIYIPTAYSNDNCLQNIPYTTTKKHGDIVFKTTID